MTSEIKMVFLIALVLFTMQSVGGWFQIQDYKKAVRRMRSLGNIGIGQTRGGFLNGNLVIIACDGYGVITGVEVMEGLSFLAHFKPRSTLLGVPFEGKQLDEFAAMFDSFSKKKRKRYKGYIQAVDALRQHLKQSEASGEAERISVCGDV